MKLSMHIVIVCLFICSSVTRIATAQTISTIAGGSTGHGGYWGDGGPATNAELSTVAMIAIDAHGDLFIADGHNHRVRKVDAATGVITTVVGTGVSGYNGDGILAGFAQLNNPAGVAFDAANNLYIADADNNRIRKVDAITNIISTFAGNGYLGSTGDWGPATAAKIGGGLFSCDKFGNMYIGDIRKIRKIDPTGIITTFAGTGMSGVTLDGVVATNANMSYPLGICTDAIGNVYYTDTTQAIRKISLSTGLITRVAGTGDNISSPYSGDGLFATNCHVGPFNLSVDDSGNMFIADYSNHRIEKVNTEGIIRSIAGVGSSGFDGDGGLANVARLSYPKHVVLDKCGNVFIADFVNKRVRKITYRECDYTSVKETGNNNATTITLHPNPATETLTITARVEIETVAILNAVGQCVVRRAGSGERQIPVDVSHLPPGVYMVRVNEVWTGKFVKE